MTPKLQLPLAQNWLRIFKVGYFHQDRGILQSLFTQIPSHPMLSVCQSMFSFIWSRYYGDILHSLWPLFGDSEPDDAVRDNAAGAVARMIMVQPQSVPLNQVGVI